MSRSTFDTDPTADSYYDRLGITPRAHPTTVDQAGEAAEEKYGSENSDDEDAFDAVKQAHDTLLDSMLRRTYDMFLTHLTAAEATRAFEKWQARGQPEPNTWLEGYQHVCYDGASPASNADTTAQVAVLPDGDATDSDSEEAEPNPLYGGTVSDAPTIE
jgi:DnaJ-class molecular chaperone